MDNPVKNDHEFHNVDDEQIVEDNGMKENNGARTTKPAEGSLITDLDIETMNAYKLRLTSHRKDSKTRRSKRSGLVLSVVSDVLRRDQPGEFHVTVGYPTHSIMETSNLLAARYNTLFQLYNEQLEKEKQFMDEEIVSKQNDAYQTICTALDDCALAVDDALKKQIEQNAEVSFLQCQCTALQSFLNEIEGVREERIAIMDSMLARLEDQEQYWRNLWKNTREESPVTSVLAEQLDTPLSNVPHQTLKKAKAVLPHERCTNLYRNEDSPLRIYKRGVLHELSQYITEGRNEAALDLLRKTPPDELQEDNNLLHLATAVSSPCIEVIYTIVQRRPELCKGVDLSTGNTALHFVCRATEPDERIVQLLLDAGVPLRSRNNAGFTAFHVAVLNLGDNVQHKLKRVLLRAGADVDERTTAGLTSLHLVCGNDVYLSTSHFLVRAGAALWALASHRINYPPFSVRRITPLEKSRSCYAMKTFQYLSEEMKDAQADYF